MALSSFSLKIERANEIIEEFRSVIVGVSQPANWTGPRYPKELLDFQKELRTISTDEYRYSYNDEISSVGWCAICDS